MMGILGHDRRSPVSGVLSLSSTLAHRADVPERSKEGLRHTHASAERMEQMITTLLDFTRLRFRGAPVLAREPLDMDKLARAIVDELRAANPAPESGLAAAADLPAAGAPSGRGQVSPNPAATPPWPAPP